VLYVFYLVLEVHFRVYELCRALELYDQSKDGD